MMSVTEITERPGYFNVVVYDRVSVPGERPAKVQKVVKGQRAAERAERELLRERERGSLAARRQTLSHYAAQYLHSRRAEVSAETLEDYGKVVRYIDRHSIGKRRVADITVSTVASFYADLLERGSRGAPLAPATVHGVHRILSMILKRAVVDGLLYVNPCTIARPPKKTRPQEAADAEPGIDPAVARAFLRDAADLPIHSIAAVALGTGLRRSELLALRWDDIDLDGGQLHVRGKIGQTKGRNVRRGPTKTARSTRTVPFGENVGAIFKEQRRTLARLRLAAGEGMWTDEGWVFPGRFVHYTREGEPIPAGGIWTPYSFGNEWARDRQAANEIALAKAVEAGGLVEDFEPPYTFGIHALRHAYATALLAAGVRDEVVSRRLGHSSSLVTRRVYSHALAAEAREGVDVADALL